MTPPEISPVSRSWVGDPRLATALLVVIFGVFAPHSTGAEPSTEPERLVVFMLEGPDDSSDLGEKLTSILREEAREGDRHRLVHDDPVVLSDTAVVLGCEEVSTTCLGKAAEQFDADRLIFGAIEERDGRARVTVRLYSAPRARYVESFRRVLTERDEPFEPFRRDVRRLLGLETEPSSLTIRSNIEGATVEIDGSAAGETPVVRDEFEPGSHRIRVEAEGYESWTEEVTLEPGEAEELSATLEPRENESKAVAAGGGSGGSTARGRPRTDRMSTLSKWGPWAVLGTGALSFAGAGIAGAEVNRANNDLEDWREANNDSTRICETEPECEILERGQNAQTFHRVLLGVGGAATVGGIVWMVLRTSGGRTKRAAAERRRLRITPTHRSVSLHWRW